MGRWIDSKGCGGWDGKSCDVGRGGEKEMGYLGMVRGL